jgi:hypothetical protein
MELKASHVLQVALKAGFVPANITCVGPVDELREQLKVRAAVQKTAVQGHARMLSCTFEPPDKYPTDPVATTLDLLTRGLKAPAVQSQPIRVGTKEARHIELTTRSADGMLLSVHAIALVHLGVLHRYTLSVLQERSQDGFAALQQFVTEACA